MSRKKFLQACLKTILAAAPALLFTGCAHKPVPPLFNLYGYQRLAVVPFVDESRDPALARDLAEEMTGQIVDLGALPVVQASQVADFLRAHHAKPSDLASDAGLRQGLARQFHCDLLLMGRADGYSEFLKDLPPEHSSDGWGFRTTRKVVVNADARLLDAATGNLLWTRKSQGYSWHNTWNPLPIPDSVVVPGLINSFVNLADLVKHRLNHERDDEPTAINQNDPNVLVYPKSRAFADLRGKALFEAVNYMVEDFRGHYDWTPQVRGN